MPLFAQPVNHFLRFSEMLSASQVKVIIQFCMSEGDLCSSFPTPSITFFDFAKLCFACVPNQCHRRGGIEN